MEAKQLQPTTEGALRVLNQPLRMRSDDHSGTPVALIELARRSGRLELRDEVDADEIVIEFPFGPVPQEQTGCSRFLRLRSGNYGLVA